MGLIHVRVGRELKKKMKELTDKGLFSNQAEIVREGIREVILKYREENVEKKKR